jgi:tungstate transport system substrate-binding protein
LAEVLLEDFRSRTGLRVKMVAVGSGAALKLAAQGEADVLLSHSPEAERAWLAAGHGTCRRLVMYNDFVLLGPADAPAAVRGNDPVAAFRAVAQRGARFVSRGDQSGTHVRELALWKEAGIEPRGQPWYQETGQGQGLTLDVASQKQAYVLSDRGTYLVHRKRLALQILVEGGPKLLNLYHVLTVNPERFPHVNARGGQAFADYLVSADGQAVIAEFGRREYGRSLFTPAAGQSEAALLGVIESRP